MIDINVFDGIYVSSVISPVIPINVGIEGNIKVVESVNISPLIKRTTVDWLKINELIYIQLVKQPIIVDSQIRPEIIIEQEFDLTKKELLYQVELIGNPSEDRKKKVVRYFFALKASVREIADNLKVSPSVVYKDINNYKRDVLKEIKRDLRTNKKILGHMAGMMYQIEHQVRTIWDKYNLLDADAYALRAIIRDSTTPEQRRENQTAIINAAKTVLLIHDRQQGYLDLLGKKTMNMLAVWDKFGLCGDEAIKLILSDGVDIDAKIHQVRGIIVNLISIVKVEVKDSEQRKKVFTRIARETNFNDVEEAEIIKS